MINLISLRLFVFVCLTDSPPLPIIDGRRTPLPLPSLPFLLIKYSPSVTRLITSQHCHSSYKVMSWHEYLVQTEKHNLQGRGRCCADNQHLWDVNLVRLSAVLTASRQDTQVLVLPQCLLRSSPHHQPPSHVDWTYWGRDTQFHVSLRCFYISDWMHIQDFTKSNL